MDGAGEESGRTVHGFSRTLWTHLTLGVAGAEVGQGPWDSACTSGSGDEWEGLPEDQLTGCFFHPTGIQGGCWEQVQK